MKITIDDVLGLGPCTLALIDLCQHFGISYCESVSEDRDILYLILHDGLAGVEVDSKDILDITEVLEDAIWLLIKLDRQKGLQFVFECLEMGLHCEGDPISSQTWEQFQKYKSHLLLGTPMPPFVGEPLEGVFADCFSRSRVVHNLFTAIVRARELAPSNQYQFEKERVQHYLEQL